MFYSLILKVKGNVFGAGGAKDKSKELKEREKLERRLTEVHVQ